MKKARAYIIRPSGENVPMAPTRGKRFTLKEVQEVAGGAVDVIYDDGRRCMVAGKDSLEKLLYPNRIASDMASKAMNIGYTIFGDVLVCKSGMLPREIVAVLQPREA